MGTSRVEDIVGSERVLAFNYPLTVPAADGDGEIVAAFGIVGAGPIGQHRGS